MPLRTSICAFATDLADEGVDLVLDNVAAAGLGGVSVAAAYHAARDLFPHNPRRKVGYFPTGALWFEPDPRRWEDVAVRPDVAPLARERDVLAEAAAAAERRGLALDAWVVYLHVDRPHGEQAPRNAFGDAYLTDLCPANPEVRAYVRALTADVCRYPVSRILAESLHYHGLDHGGHHEREFVGLGPRSRFLLGLCFCPHCLAAAAARGVDGESVRTAVRAELERVFADEDEPESPGELAPTDLGALAGGALAAYLDVRAETVESLAADAAEIAAAAGVDLAFIDLSGAVKGYATGRPSGAPAATLGWQFGIRPARLARCCSAVVAVAYAADPARVEEDVAAYVAAAGADRVSAVLRPSPPDCASPENLREKVERISAAGVGAVDFYHYGFVPLPRLEWVRAAVV